MRTRLHGRGRLIRSSCLALFFLFGIAETSALSAISEQSVHIDSKASEAPLPTRRQVSQAIALSAGYLERACGPNGRFVYEVDINTGRQTPSYNIVRHAGAIYALAMLNRSTPEPKAVDAMVRAATFMRQNYIGPGVRPNQLIVWSGTREHRSQAELGATGLGLVALMEVRRVAPKLLTLEELKALARFVLFMQRPDGSFVLAYRPETGPVEHIHSPFYSGEAALGLIALYEADHSRELLTAAGKALSYIARNHPEISEGQPDQWALIAIARLFHYCDGETCPGGASRTELSQYSIQICNWIVHQQLRNPASSLDGAFDPAGQTAAAGAFMEGLLAPLEFLPNGEFRARVEAAAGRSLAFLLRLQIVSGQFAGGMPGALRTSAPSSSEVRIDFVQHALCAWLRYQQFIAMNSISRELLQPY
jgi:hypothetical protein